MHTQTIGIIDSGVGGLSIYQEIKKAIPHSLLVYLADSRYAPYGSKDIAFITKRSVQLVTFLAQKGITVIVVACNTITVTCLEYLRQTFSHITFIGTVPALKQASQLTKTKNIALLATTRTVESRYVADLQTQFSREDHVTLLGDDSLVPCIEQGEITGKRIQTLLENVLEPIAGTPCDVIVLGCTHFPFLKPVIATLLGPNVLLLDSGEAIAKRLVHLTKSEVTDLELSHPDIFFTTGSQNMFRTVITQLITKDINEESILQAQI